MANTIQPSDEELRDLYSLASNVPFDDRLNHQGELNDLNITLIPHPDFLIPYEDRNEYRNEYRNDTVTVELTEHERLVLDAIHQDATTTIRGMVAYLGISKFSVSRALKGLQKKQVIERMGSTKKGSWKVKA